MKKFIIILAVLVITAYIGWQNRVTLMVQVAPILKGLTNPIGENIPVDWQQGPIKAALSPDQRSPNIILIMVDDMGFNDISLYNGGAGDGNLQTPNIDALAHQGVRFENGYAANAICAPSRASTLTGRYSTRFGFEFTPIFKLGPVLFQWMEDINPSSPPMFIDTEKASNLPPFQGLGMPSEEITIAEVLKQQGYQTAHIGKWHLGSVKGMRPEDQGFDESLYLEGSLYLPKNDPYVVNATVPQSRIDNMIWAGGQYAASFNGSKPFAPAGYLTDYYTDEAIKVIEANRHRPFFLYLAHWGVHDPLQAAKHDYEALSHIKDHRLRVYSAMIRALDRSVEKINATLLELGLSNNTLVIFTSDNGGAGYLDLKDINKPYRGWKITHFEGGIRVPFMAKWPAQIEAGTVMTDPIHHIDLFHTIAAAANAQVPQDRTLDGVDLLPYIRKEIDQAPHDTLFWRQGYHQTVLHKGWKLIRSNQPEKPAGSGQKQFLFNLQDDPTEQQNLASQYPEKVAQLAQLLAVHNAEQAQPLWPSVLEVPVLIDKSGEPNQFDGDAEYIYWQN
jgi:uncharacterized sulfatase